MPELSPDSPALLRGRCQTRASRADDGGGGEKLERESRTAAAPLRFAREGLAQHLPRNCSDRGDGRHLFGDMTDTLFLGQVDSCDVV